MTLALDFSTPRLIRSEKEYDLVVDELRRLLDKNPKVGSRSEERIEFLSVLVEDFDRKHHRLPGAAVTPQQAVTFMLEQFGRPQRNSGVQCDCERDSNASVLQVLSLANHPRIRQKIADDKGHVARILKAHADNDKRIDEVFLVALCRPPTDAERQACAKYVRESATEAEGLRGVMWSVLNTREFLLQH